MPANQSDLFVSGSSLYLTGFEGQLVEEIDFTTDMTSLDISTTGMHQVFKANGSTPKASIQIFTAAQGSCGVPDAWKIKCNASASPPLYLSGTMSKCGSPTEEYAVVSAVVTPAWANEPDWDQDRWFIQVLYSGTVVDASGGPYYDAISFGVVPSGSATAWYSAGTSRRFLIIQDNGTTFGNALWRTEMFAPSEIVTCTSALVSGSQLLLYDAQRGRLALKQGATTFANNMMPDGDWDFDTVGAHATGIAGTVSAGDFPNGPGILMYPYTERITGNAIAQGIEKIRLYVSVPKG
jgi:hypothetical protein